MRPGLRSQTQAEPAAAEQVQIVGRVRQMQRTARQCDGDIGHQVRSDRPRGERQRQEGIVCALEGEQPISPAGHQFGCASGYLAGPPVKLQIDSHNYIVPCYVIADVPEVTPPFRYASGHGSDRHIGKRKRRPALPPFPYI